MCGTVDRPSASYPFTKSGPYATKQLPQPKSRRSAVWETQPLRRGRKKICGKQNTDKKRKEKQPEQHTSMHWEKSEQTVALKSSPSLRWCSSGHSPPLSPKTLKHVSDEIHKHKQKKTEKMKEKSKAIWWASSKTRLKFREARKHAASMRPSTSAGSSASVAGA